MTEDFESRLGDGLARRAHHMPAYEGDLQAIRRRGRNRRWATRGAGAVGALAILGGGVAALNAMNDDASGDTVATEDGGEVQTFIPTATPTPEPTPQPTPAPNESETLPPTEPTPDPLERSGDPVGPDDASLLVATGWGVGLLNSGTGAIFAPEACCTGNDLRWFDQPDTARAEGLAGAVTVRDDLRGGYVFASRNALYWTPAAYLTDQLEPLRIDLAGTGVNGSLRLWDVADIDGEVTVLYSTTVTSIGENEGDEGTTDLRSKVLDGAAATTDHVVLASQPATDLDGNRRAWRGAAWLSDGGVVQLTTWGRCPMIDGPEGALPPTIPFQEEFAFTVGPDEECSSPELSAMTVSDDGATMALVRTDAGASPELAVFDLATGSLLASIGLEPGKEAQGNWTEIDLASNKVLLSRGEGMADDAWPNLDEMQVIDVETGATSPLIFFGAPTFARSAVSTLGLPAVAPGDPLAFYRNGLAPPVETQPSPEPQPTPEPPPEATPEVEPQPGAIPDENRVPVGDGVNVVAADALVGTDGCAGPPGGGVCVGSDFASAAADLDTAFGAGERTDDPDTFLEGEPHPAGTHVWADDRWTATVEEVEGVVVAIRVAPTDATRTESPLAAGLTIGDVLAALGPPADIFQGGGEGIEVVVLEYQTEAATVTYQFIESWGSETRLIDQGGALEEVPADYDSLPINGYTAQAYG